MYCGRGPDGKERRQWNPGETEPILVYRSHCNTDSFFPAILLLAIKSSKGGDLIPGFGIPGDREDWLAWLDDIFLDGCNLEALAKTVQTSEIPPVEIWIALPYPDPAQKKFGYLSDHKISFADNSDRAFALKWWINRFLAKWYGRIKIRGLDRYISLKGFYWARESMTPRDRLMLPGIISHIRSLGFSTMWIPHYAITPLLNISDPGFDVTIIQPSYLQNPQKKWQRLKAAFKRAKKYGAGIEIELDTSALFENSPGHRIALDYLNRGLPEYEGYMTESYIAYYTGYKTILLLHKNGKPLYDYLYLFVKGKLAKIDYCGIDY